MCQAGQRKDAEQDYNRTSLKILTCCSHHRPANFPGMDIAARIKLRSAATM
jgi:hypothetical protein